MLDAPALQDDFYLNLVDWSSSNLLAVGLGSCVYLWNALTSKVPLLLLLLLLLHCETGRNAGRDARRHGFSQGIAGLWGNDGTSRFDLVE